MYDCEAVTYWRHSTCEQWLLHAVAIITVVAMVARNPGQKVAIVVAAETSEVAIMRVVARVVATANITATLSTHCDHHGDQCGNHHCQCGSHSGQCYGLP